MVEIKSAKPRIDGTHRISQVWADSSECDLCDTETGCLIISVDTETYPMIRICLECIGKGLIELAWVGGE